MRWKASFIVLALIATFVAVMSASAFAKDDNPNSADYWEGRFDHEASCYKHEGNSDHGKVTNDGDAVTLNPFNQSWTGDHWEALIVKGGSVDYGDGPGNVVFEHPSAGVAYFAPLNAGEQQSAVSHWIVCKGTTPEPEPPTLDASAVCLDGIPGVLIEVTVTEESFVGTEGVDGFDENNFIYPQGTKSTFYPTSVGSQTAYLLDDVGRTIDKIVVDVEKCPEPPPPPSVKVGCLLDEGGDFLSYLATWTLPEGLQVIVGDGGTPSNDTEVAFHGNEVPFNLYFYDPETELTSEATTVTKRDLPDCRPTTTTTTTQPEVTTTTQPEVTTTTAPPDTTTSTVPEVETDIADDSSPLGFGIGLGAVAALVVALLGGLAYRAHRYDS